VGHGLLKHLHEFLFERGVLSREVKKRYPISHTGLQIGCGASIAQTNVVANPQEWKR